MNVDTLTFNNNKFQNLFEVMGILDHYQVKGIFSDDQALIIELVDGSVVHPTHVQFLNSYGAFNQMHEYSWEVPLD